MGSVASRLARANIPSTATSADQIVARWIVTFFTGSQSHGLYVKQDHRPSPASRPSAQPRTGVCVGGRRSRVRQSTVSMFRAALSGGYRYTSVEIGGEDRSACVQAQECLQPALGRAT